jgi:hypothetical protein
MNKIRILGISLLVVPIISPLLGCASAYDKMVSADSDRMFSKVYVTDYIISWESAIEALKTSPMEVVNRENGTLQTKWIDNTVERNAMDSYGNVVPYVRARFRFQVTLVKGYHEGKPSVRVNVQKEQQYQRDVLDSWRALSTDGIQEQAMLYRIGKMIEFKSRLLRLENDRLKKQVNEPLDAE